MLIYDDLEFNTIIKTNNGDISLRFDKARQNLIVEYHGCNWVFWCGADDAKRNAQKFVDRLISLAQTKYSLYTSNSNITMQIVLSVIMESMGFERTTNWSFTNKSLELNIQIELPYSATYIRGKAYPSYLQSQPEEDRAFYHIECDGNGKEKVMWWKLVKRISEIVALKLQLQSMIFDSHDNSIYDE